MLRAVIFDMDDTLIDWSQREGNWIEHGKAFLQPMRDYLADQGHDMPDVEQMSMIWSAKVQVAWERVSPPEWYCPRQIDHLRATLDEIGLDTASLDLEAVQQHYGWKLVPGVTLFPDTLHVLETLRDVGIRTALLTNADMPMWMRDRELIEFGLIDYLDVRTTAADVGHLKPHRRAFEYVLDGLGVTAEEAIMVGDRLQDDVKGAQGIGMRGVWVRRGSTPPVLTESDMERLRPNATIDSLSELFDTLDLWYPGWRTNGNR